MTILFRLAMNLGVLLILAAAPVRAQTQAETLADIRAQMTALAGQLSGLRQELVGSGATGGATGGGSALERMDAIEAELVRLTGKTEELQNRINQVVADGTNRLGDLEFRLVELEGGDTGTLGQTPPLGGDVGATDGTVVAPSDPQPGAGGADLAENEQADFDRAKAALDTGDFRGAADLFATFAQSYTGGPLTAQALFLRGDALAGLGETSAAARAYLDSFSGAPDGPSAPDALFKLGLTLGQLGQMQEACVTLGEVGARFGRSAAAGQAASEMQALQCN